MHPLVLTNAFLRPQATLMPSGDVLLSDTDVYASVEEMPRTIFEEIGATPLMLPTVFDEATAVELLRHVDGIMLPGAVSNMRPELYGGVDDGHPQVFDPAHDALDLFLVRQARAQGIPFFGICRSMQAMNVAFGGTLNQKIKPGGPIDHSCSDPCDGHDDAPPFMHEAMIAPGGLFAPLFPGGRITINSMHEQAVDRVGDGLRVEALAADGVIEAISWPGAGRFFAAVQWHPEAMPKNAVSQVLFRAFRADVAARFAARRAGK